MRNERERFYPWLYGWNGNLLCFVYFYGVTMNTQPEALRLAGGLWDVAAELRRLLELNQELVEALKLLRTEAGEGDLAAWFIKEVTDDLIAKAEVLK